jgi:rRNA-processing protein FCF1
MKLGTFSMSLPVFVVESDVTYQTVRSPTVFERMILRLCARYGNAPGIGDMTLFQVFEEQLGVTSAGDLVGPSVENLVHLGVISCPASQDIMLSQVSQLRLTPEGRDFLERDRLPTQPKRANVKHLFLPLLNAVKPHGLDHRLSTTPADWQVDDAVLRPADCSHVVRKALASERHPWKTPNTELGHVESRVTSVLWEKQQLVIECDRSAVLSVSSASSPELDRWLANAQPDVIWEHILEPLCRVDTRERWPDLGPHPLRGATGVMLPVPAATGAAISTAASEAVLRVLGDAADLANYPDADIVVLSAGAVGPGRVSSREGSLVIELPPPAGLPAGFDCLTVRHQDLAPSLFCTGVVKIIWAGREREIALRVQGDESTALQVWSDVRGALETLLQGGAASDVLALAAIWEPPGATIAHWCSRVEALSLGDLLREAKIFERTLSRFAAPSREQWGADWHDALTNRVHEAFARLAGDITVEAVIEWLPEIDRLLAADSRSLAALLLSRCATIDDVDTAVRLRRTVGQGVELPLSLFGDRVIAQWIAEALTDEVHPTFYVGPYPEPIEGLRLARRSVLHDIGLKSLDDAGSGALSLSGVKTSALSSASRWQATMAMLTESRPSLSGKWPDRLVVLDQKIAAWRELASRRLAPPGPPGQRLVVLDSNALMSQPDVLFEMRRTDVPVVPRRVLEELDGLKSSSDEEDAGMARAAIRALERAGQTVRYESEVLDLLPPDWGKSSDNRILSVALHLRLSDVVIVTGDVNLRNKARAEDIQTMSLEQYVGRRPGPSGSGDSTRRRG